MKTFSPNALCGMFEIDRAVAVRVVRNVTPDEEETKGRPTFKISTFAKALEAHHLRNASNNDVGAESGASSLTQARIRIANASASAKERQNRIATGQLADVNGIAGVFDVWMQNYRQKLLVMPGKIADSLVPHSELDRGAIHEKIRVEVYDYLNECVAGMLEIDAKYKALIIRDPTASFDTVKVDDDSTN